MAPASSRTSPWPGAETPQRRSGHNQIISLSPTRKLNSAHPTTWAKARPILAPCPGLSARPGQGNHGGLLARPVHEAHRRTHARAVKTGAKDATVIADAARTMPHTPRSIDTSDEDEATLSMVTGFDLDLARQVNQAANRIRGQSPPRPRRRCSAPPGEPAHRPALPTSRHHPPGSGALGGWPSSLIKS